MRSRLLALLAATVATAAPLAVGAAPASAATCAAPRIAQIETLPGTVVLGTSGTKTLDVQARVTRGCEPTSVKIVYTTPASTSPSFAMVGVSGDKDSTTYWDGLRFSPKDLVNAEAGGWKAKVTVTWKRGTSTASVSATKGFKVVRQAKVTTNAAPEPVSKGATLKVSGKLTRANWQTAKYAAYTQQKVALQFQPAKGSYTTLKTVTSGTGGALAASVKATKDGCYRFVFAGSATTAKVTGAADCVDVR